MSLPEYGTPNNRDAALDYAAQGTPVFPCRPGGKAPLTQRGHLDASTDPDQIRAWWARWPEANIGVPTGERSGILALDVDDPAGLDELEHEHGRLPATRTHSTGSGGMHYLYLYPAGANVRNSAGKLAPGIDTRGEGGYIIVPPSSTTRPYQLLDELPLADTPAWLIEALTRPRSEARSSVAPAPGAGRPSRSAPSCGPIASGTRNATLASIAGRLHNGRTLDELTRELLDANAARCRPPLPEVEVESVARSIYRRPPVSRNVAATPEVHAALELVEADLRARDWRKGGGRSAQDATVALIKLARAHGELIPGGIRVSVGLRPWALATAVHRRTMLDSWKNGVRRPGVISRLKNLDVIRGDDTPRIDGQAASYVLVIPEGRARFHHSPIREVAGGGGETLRAPRLRWSGPHAPVVKRPNGAEFRRLSKSGGAIIDALEYAGGSVEVDALADAMGVRARDLRRRELPRLEAAAVVECSGDTVTLTRDWLDALNLDRERAGEIAAYQRDMHRYAEEQAAYRYHLERERAGGITVCPPIRPPLRDITNLPPAPGSDAPPEPDPELVAALRRELMRSPGLIEQGPSWLGRYLWSEELYTGPKPTPEQVREALLAARVAA